MYMLSEETCTRGKLLRQPVTVGITIEIIP